jgi:hypothetical protein
MNPTDPLTPEVEAYLDSHRSSVVDRKLWSQMESFVHDAVRAVRPSDVVLAKELTNSLTRLAAYSLRIGLPLTVSAVLDPDNITSFLNAARNPRQHHLTGALSTAVIERISSDTRRIGRALNPKAPWPVPARRSSAHLVKPPYTAAEESSFVGAARRSANVHQLALVVLGFGAGLDGGELRRVTTHDVIADSTSGPTRYFVRGSKPDRLVPLLERYSSDMTTVLAGLEPGEHLLGKPENRNRVSNLTGFLTRRQGSPLVSSRMRSTWMVRHLNNGCDLRHLVAMAGLTTAKTVWSLLGHAHPLDLAVATDKAFTS